MSAAPVISRDELHQQNLQSANTGVRWQAQMEDAIATYRERTHVLSRMSFATADADQMQVHATIANAAATAALALAIANAGSDLEMALGNLRDSL